MFPFAFIARRSFQCALSLGLAVLLSSTPARAEEPVLKLKNGDVWVMAGDSITAQRLHTNFIEAYYRTRYPSLSLHFRNSGIGGNRTGNVLQRFDYDVAAWKPTIVSVELGMNDVNGPVDVYIKGMKEIIAKIRAIPAQPVLISSSPVDDGSLMGDWKSPRCQNIHPFTEALKKLADEEQVVFVDQYHALIDLWGHNRRDGAEAAARAGKLPAPPPPAAPGAPAKPAPLPPSLIPLHGDAVHTGEVGQYTMASAILEGLKAQGEVSSATLSADGKVIESKGCTISAVKASGGTLSFTRLDESGPWPILPAAKTALQLRPQILDLSQYLLKVSGLGAGNYAVSINGKPAATVTGKELATGWNITTAFDSVLGQRSVAILALINKLESPLNNEWRAASKAKDATKLAAAQKAIDDSEAEIQKACQPAPLQFEIAPVK